MTATRATDTLRVLSTVLLPTMAAGVAERRPALMALVDRLGGDERAIREVARLRESYGEEPLPLRVPGRSVVLVLSPDDVGTVLGATPDPFHPARTGTVAALRQFQPHAVPGTPDRHQRALDTGQPLHHLAEPFHEVIREEATPALDWHGFHTVWQRIVRRIVLGPGARDDEQLTNQLDRLRRPANWAWLMPRRPRQELAERLRSHVNRPVPNTLAAALPPGVDPVDQVSLWLFAFDAAGMATFRTLAVLATHPSAAVRAERSVEGPARLPFLRASVLEVVRLWPTTPAILRETIGPVRLGGRELPAGTTLLVYTPYFHRAVSNRFEPDRWLDGRARRHLGHPALAPFGAGPGECPGRNLVLFTTSTMLAVMRASHDYRLVCDHGLTRREHLPATLDNFSLRFTATAR